MKYEVALVNMPFFGTSKPSLGLGLLKAGLLQNNISTVVHYFNLNFAERIGMELYKYTAQFPTEYMLQEWIFSSALWEENPDQDKIYLDEVLGHQFPEADLRDRIYACCRQVEPFLDHCISAFPWNSYRVVGFSSMFQQQTAALALAYRLKKQFPDLFIVIGGSNCEAEMGVSLFQSFPFIDSLCSGEADASFPELVRRVLRNEPPGTIQGVLHRNSQTIPATDVPLGDPVRNMDALPYPDFDEYFFSRSTVPGDNKRIMFESSRGCWWGEKQHCTFCGLNGSTMAFRFKSSERILDELQWLVERYGAHSKRIFAVDNIIPLEYFKSVLPALQKMGLDIELFYETKSNLKQEYLELSSSAGLRQIQPGIESLSTPVLKLMRKGVTAIQNVQLLKWCKQYGLLPLWNYLVGFPGELAEFYDGQVELIDSISHLQPPLGPTTHRVRFDRFSPYFTQPKAFGLSNMRPYRSYYHVYRGLTDSAIHDMAYHFEADFAGQENVSAYADPMDAAITGWMQVHSDSAMFSVRVGPRFFICDFRPCARQPVYLLANDYRLIYEQCDRITSVLELKQILGKENKLPVSDEYLQEKLEPLLARKLMIREGNSYLSLAVPLGYQYSPSGSVFKKFLDLFGLKFSPPGTN